MATTFLEPGGDATFNVGTTANGSGLWGGVSGTTPTVVTDFVNGTHIKSIKFPVNIVSLVKTPNGTLSGSGSRSSFYLYINALPTGIATVARVDQNSGVNTIAQIKLTSAGVLQMFEATVQIGSNGSTLSTGKWYRISLALTVTSTTVNRFELFVDGSSSISVTNATLTNAAPTTFSIGTGSPADTTFDRRYSDFYIDNSSSLTDPGNIWVTAKRPFSNGTTNGFTTQIGAGGSGYGTGHAPQVNERPLSTTNGWSMVGAGSAITEEYTVEGKSVGDMNITGLTIVDIGGWIYSSSLAGETASLILSGATSNVALTSTNTMFTAFAGSTTYPAGGTDIGMVTTTAITTVSLFECGIMVAFLGPPVTTTTTVSPLSLLGAG